MSSFPPFVRRLKAVGTLALLLVYVMTQWGCEVSSGDQPAAVVSPTPPSSGYTLFTAFPSEGLVEAYTVTDAGVTFASHVNTGGSPLFVSFGDVGADNTTGVGFVINSGSNNVQPLQFDAATQTIDLLGAPFDSGVLFPGAPVVDDENRLLFIPSGNNDEIAVFQYDQTGAATPVVGSPFSTGLGAPATSLVLHRIGDANFLYASSINTSLVAAGTYTDTGVLSAAGAPVDFGTPSIGLDAYSAVGNTSELDFLYVLGMNNTVVIGSISRAAGTLGQIVADVPGPAVPPNPGEIEVVTGGTGGVDFVTVSNPDSGSLSAFEINLETGALTESAGSPIALIGMPGPLAFQPGLDLFVGRFGVGGTTLNVFDANLDEVTGSPFLLNSNPHDMRVNRFP